VELHDLSLLLSTQKMALQLFLMETIHQLAVVLFEIIQFNAGDVTQTHIITINDDDECEKDPNENFFSNIALDSGIPDITVTVPQATVTINDTAEQECEQISVGYDPDTYVTTETSGSVNLTVRVFSHPGGAPRPFTLVVNTEDGTATVAMFLMETIHQLAW
jgi:hypothetical protein